MAKIQAIHTCGHTEEYKIAGRKNEAYWQSRYEAEACWECRKAEENIKAQLANQSNGLPALSGSEKQIAWAETLRMKSLKSIEQFIDDARKLGERQGVDQAQIDEGIGKLQAAADKIKGVALASWWIDRRDHTAQEFLREALTRG